MKLPSLPKRGRAAAFTLTEVLVVITVIAALFALVLGAFSYAQNKSKREATVTRLQTIKSALELYRNDMGEYPEPATPGETVDIAGKTYEVSGGAMLYQALSGDGNDQILIESGEETKTSDGNLDDEEAALVKMKEMPKNLWLNMADRYFMIDGWGRPFQYVKAAAADPTDPGDAPDALTISNTYDLWSYGDDVENTTARSVEILTNQELRTASLRWISSWEQR